MDPLVLFVAHPWLALLPSLGFAALGYWRRRRVAWVAAAAWLLYAGYETAMARRLLCSGECNIRIDLLLLYPALLGLTVVAVLLGGRRRKGG